MIGLLAGIAAGLTEVIPEPLLLALAGLATVGVFSNALQEITGGPLLLGPLFAFVIGLSKISFLGFGPFFWALVLGTGISFLLEREEWHHWRQEVTADGRAKGEI
jgi:benzoate membrane transport protein